MIISKRFLRYTKAINYTSYPKRSFLLGYDNTNIDVEEEFVTKKIYKKYSPSRSVLFNYSSSEGNLAKIFEATHNYGTLSKLWTATVPASLGIAGYFYQMANMGALYLYTPHLVLVPIVSRILNNMLVSRNGKSHVSDIYLLQNGDQILLRTIDGIWHKICIQDIQSYSMDDQAKHIKITINVFDKKYVISTQNKKFTNFEILNRIMSGV